MRTRYSTRLSKVVVSTVVVDIQRRVHMYTGHGTISPFSLLFLQYRFGLVRHTCFPR